MSLKVLAISSYLGATWNSVRPEGEMLIALAEAGVEVTVMTQGEAEYAARFREAGLDLIDFHPARKFSWTAIRRIRAELRAGGFDVVYCFNNWAISNTAWAAMGLPVRLVTYRGQTGNINRWDPACYVTHLHPRVNGIVCVANAVRNDLLRQSRLGPDRIVTIYKGHDPTWYVDVRKADLKAFGIPKGASVVVCVANDRPRKGVPILIEAFHQVTDNDWHLLLVGGGMESEAYQRMIRQGAASDRIHTAGFRTDVLELIAASRIGVLPTVKREGLPKTVIEAMALGLPVVVTDSGGSSELVIEGETGYVIPSGDASSLAAALNQMITHQDRIAEMGKAARMYLFENFSTYQSGQQMCSFFHKLVEGKA